jgi:hypothetical protein
VNVLDGGGGGCSAIETTREMGAALLRTLPYFSIRFMPQNVLHVSRAGVSRCIGGTRAYACIFTTNQYLHEGQRERSHRRIRCLSALPPVTSTTSAATTSTHTPSGACRNVEEQEKRVAQVLRAWGVPEPLPKLFQPTCGRQNADNRVHSHPQTTVLPGYSALPDLARTRQNGLGKQPGRMHEAPYVSDDKKNVVRTRWTPMRVKAVRGLIPRAHPSLQSSSTTHRP